MSGARTEQTARSSREGMSRAGARHQGDPGSTPGWCGPDPVSDDLVPPAGLLDSTGSTEYLPCLVRRSGAPREVGCGDAGQGVAEEAGVVELGEVVEQVGQGVAEDVEGDRRRVGQADGHGRGDDLGGMAGRLLHVDRRPGGVEVPGVEGVAESRGDRTQDHLVVRDVPIGRAVGGTLGEQGVGAVHPGGGQRGGEPGREVRVLGWCAGAGRPRARCGGHRR